MVEVSPVYPTSRVFITAAPAAPVISLPRSAGVTLKQYVAPPPPPAATVASLAAVQQQVVQQQQQQPRLVYILKPEAKVESPAAAVPPPVLPLEPLPQVVVTSPPHNGPAVAAAVACSPTGTASTPSPMALDNPHAVSSPPLLPLDLSTKQRHDSAASTSCSSFFDIGLGPRSNSCSSTSSSVFSDEERRRKRKDQNKAAAHSYRQRKKSFSDFIESEHEKLSRKNTELKSRKHQLETQIKNMRALLDQVAQKEARQQQEQQQQQQHTATTLDGGAAEPRRRNLSAMAAIAIPVPASAAPPAPTAAAALAASQMMPPPMEIRPRSMSDVSPLMLPQHPSEDVANAMGVMRERKNTWPVANAARSPSVVSAAAAAAAAAAASVTGRERKKEQNKLASRRFRQRRKLELNQCEHEGQRLEAKNKRLREACAEMESKIRLLKDIMYKQNLKNLEAGNAMAKDGSEAAAAATATEGETNKVGNVATPASPSLPITAKASIATLATVSESA